ncbi:uncharacterized protein LOC111905734 [Lactuca sativa]|uniref:HMA domain-containing protein n=1 Tax=Lactuca sativa TaxID=4236 RepID=A0A9R1WDF4_LACSA|nr:uncharacterized protein LOC111905734 [Lactuca sativa]XP_042755498.1 uncharacterized protein LOC111905734 [Lactuca sativa]XP_052624124.1 uncharacterized protein LOC111905734 [Lactuca sativa]KAJ0221868.1 hypothetical protein LSAT_V11C200094330 [Lactuca sativa]
MTTTPMTIVLQIDPFCNCEGHIHQVKKTLRDIGGVKLLAMNPEMGKFTILTAKHPEVIKFAFTQTFRKKNIILSLEHPNQLPGFNNPDNLMNISRQTPVSFATPLGTADVHDIAKAFVTMSHAKGLKAMEFTQSNTIKMNFTNRDNDQPSTSRSSLIHNVRDDHDGVHVKYDGFEYGPPLPPPPPNTTKPSAPLIPTTENYVYGHPAELYGVPRSSRYDDPHGCCTIL